MRAVWERMVDLSLPFSTGNVYDIRMAGFYSLKRLVPVFSDYSYQDLEISYGMDAVEKWREYCTADAEKSRKSMGSWSNTVPWIPMLNISCIMPWRI